MNRYAKSYSKSAIFGSDFSTQEDFNERCLLQWNKIKSNPEAHFDANRAEIMKRENGDKSQFEFFETQVLKKNERIRNNTITIENNGYSLSSVEIETFIVKELIKMGKTFYLSDLKMLKLEKEKLRYKKWNETKKHNG